MLIADEEGDRGLENWDVSVFRLPRTEKIKKCKVNERVKRLELEFADEGGELPLRNELPDFC